VFERLVYGVPVTEDLRQLICTHIAIAAALNIDRIVNWLNEVPRAKTRVSRFAALAES
jgi:hypothetical protein